MTPRAQTLLPYTSIHWPQIHTIIDTRSPAEYAEDHIPGAINCPVLNDQERATIGTLYKQVSPFVARKHGAICTARNIAQAIETHFIHHPKTWTPLIYCWRGGQRSGAMQIILREIGWNALRLEGGYKAYRSHVLHALETAPSRFSYIVIGGPTGSGKTKLLHHLRAIGAQTLDLEDMARHKGSVLGQPPHAQPQSRKMFDTLFVQALDHFCPDRPIFVEAESRRIGIVHLPQAFIKELHTAPILLLNPPKSARLSHLIEEYGHFMTQPDLLQARLNALRPLHAKDQVDKWIHFVNTEAWTDLVLDLLDHHYDPLYQRAFRRDYTRIKNADLLNMPDLSETTFMNMAQHLCKKFCSPHTP